MKKIILILTVIIIFLVLTVLGYDQASGKTPGNQAGKILTAVRITGGIVLDGRLDEESWQGPYASGFIQDEPEEGSPSTEETKVWVAFDDKNLYVAAKCLDLEPEKILSRLGRRDSQVDSDWFFFAVDPYFDRRSGYMFGVNPAGSIYDAVLSNDVNEDDTWDGVWDYRAAVGKDGWSVEMKIPFNQLRFPARDEYVWGVNFRRIIKRKNETSTFAFVPRKEAAFCSRFARLEGVRGIKPGRHLEFYPYAVGQGRFQPAEEGNPFQPGRSGLVNAGFDLKLGLKSNLTLDTTVNPDFGQVEVDPAVINLSAYETYYQEKRPFFIEGASIFDGFGRGGVYMDANINWPSPSFFYSRRIGREPQGYVTEAGYYQIPDRTSILGAAKLTGKLGQSWNLGFISALTAREFAGIDQSGFRLKQEVEPFSYYGVFRAQKEIKGGKSGVGLLATGVMRDVDSEPLTGILNERAFSLAADGWVFLDSERRWVVGGWLGGTSVSGSAGAILRLQQSSIHYFQRPDAGHVELDPERTSLSGWGGRLNLAKQNGNFLFLLSAGALSPGFDPNDAGFQYGSSDVIQFQILPAYQWTKPGKVFLYALVFAGVFRNYDFGGNKIWDGALLSFQGKLRNFWEFNTMLAVNPETMSITLTRGGPRALVPGGYQIDLMVSSDSRKSVVVEASGSTYQRPRATTEFSGQLSLRWKPGSNFSLSLGPTFEFYQNDIQWVRRVTDPVMTETYGNRYVFGHIDQKVLGSEIRLDWTFTPRLTLQAYLQPFIAVGHYDQFKELARPAAFEYNLYGEGSSSIELSGGTYAVDPDGTGSAETFSFPDPDFNYKSLRGTVVLRWEYRPGSLIYLVWTQNRADFSNPGTLSLGRDLGDLFRAPGDNIFLIKISYRWAI